MSPNPEYPGFSTLIDKLRDEMTACSAHRKKPLHDTRLSFGLYGIELPTSRLHRKIIKARVMRHFRAGREFERVVLTQNSLTLVGRREDRQRTRSSSVTTETP